MIKEEIKKEIIDIINKNKYYFSRKEICELLFEIAHDIHPMTYETMIYEANK